MLIKSASMLFVFALNLYLSRKLGASGAGIFFLSVTTVIVAATIARLGVDHALVRFISTLSQESRNADIFRIFRASFVSVFMSTLTIFTLLFFHADTISNVVFNKPEMGKTLQVFSLSLLALNAYTITAYSLQGLGQVRTSVIVLNLLPPLFTLGFAFVLLPTLGIIGGAVAYFFAAVMTLLIGFTTWKVHTRRLVSEVAPSFALREFMKSSFPLWIVGMMNMLTTWSPLIILGILASSEQVGIYNAALRIAMLISFILLAMNSATAPRFAALYSAGKLADLESLIRISTKILMLTCIPIATAIFCFPGEIMGLFGQEFLAGTSTLLILSAGQIINVTTGSVGILLMMSGNEKVVRNILVFSTLLLIVMAFMMIPRFGMIGCATATAFCVILQNFLMLAQVKKNVGVNVFGARVYSHSEP
ncbi:flippase [bacterium]|nr:flippase [bacterium]